MVKKIVDIKAKNPNSKPKVSWKKSAKPAKSLFFIGLIIVFFILINFIGIFTAGKTYLSEIKNFGQQGLSSLLSASEKVKVADFNQAAASFKQAEATFNLLSKDTWFLQNDLINPELLLTSAKLVASAGQDLSKIADKLKPLPQNLIDANAKFLQDKYTRPQNLTDNLLESIEQVKSSAAKIDQVVANLDSKSFNLIPNNLITLKQDAKTQLQDLQQSLNSLITYLEVVADLLGSKVPHTYLILIQNNYESRPAGGFLGSMVYAEVNAGILTSFDFKDVYDFDGILTDNPPELPPEYQGFNQKLWIRDANFTPDFAISAARVEKLLQRAKAPSVDTVLSIDQTFIEDLLQLTGPILLPEYNAQITAKNYFTVLTYLVEANKEANSNDKQILGTFLTEFEKQVFQLTNFQALFQVFSNNISQKHIQIFSKKEFIQDQIELFNVGNTFSINKPNQDLLLITNTSIGGNKTDRYLKQRFIHNTSVSQNGQIQNTLTIRKFHAFTNSEEFTWQAQLARFGVTELVDYARYILGRGDNVSMVKVYIPDKSKIIAISGHDPSFKPKMHFDTDLSQNYLLLKTSLKPGKTNEVTITYQPPIKLKFNPVSEYSLKLIKQAGTTNTVFQKTYSAPNLNQPKLYTHLPDLTSFDQAGKPTVEFTFQNDQELVAVFAKN